MNSRKLLAKIVDKWPAKVLSVAAALVLLVFHRMSTLESRFLSVPLQIESGDSGLVPASACPQLARVRLRGEADSIYPILDEEIEAYIDLSKHTGEGWYRLPVQVRKKGSALSVGPLEISVDPLEIPIRLERRAIKTVPVIPPFMEKEASP